jgi:uncharacterized protein (TIGR01777 family)
MAVVLITGGSGLVGRALTKALLARGDEVRWLSRAAGSWNGVRAYEWDVTHGTIDAESLRGVERIVHLAGASIAGGRWSKARISELISTRAGSARLLLRCAREAGCRPQCIVSASGVGYYGAVTQDEPFTEDDPPGTDTIARITVEWERAVDEWASQCRVVKLRTPVVLALEGGALAKLAALARCGLAAPLGSGTQWMPWIHIEDLTNAYVRALNDKTMHGAYNVIGGNSTNREFMQALAEAVRRPMWLPPVPGPLLRMALGEVAELLLKGSPVSSSRAKGAFRQRGRGLKEELLTLLKQR